MESATSIPPEQLSDNAVLQLLKFYEDYSTRNQFSIAAETDRLNFLSQERENLQNALVMAERSEIAMMSKKIIDKFRSPPSPQDSDDEDIDSPMDPQSMSQLFNVIEMEESGSFIESGNLAHSTSQAPPQTSGHLYTIRKTPSITFVAGPLPSLSNRTGPANKSPPGSDGELDDTDSDEVEFVK